MDRENAIIDYTYRHSLRLSKHQHELLEYTKKQCKSCWMESTDYLLNGIFVFFCYVISHVGNDGEFGMCTTVSDPGEIDKRQEVYRGRLFHWIHEFIVGWGNGRRFGGYLGCEWKPNCFRYLEKSRPWTKCENNSILFIEKESPLINTIHCKQ